MNERAAAGAPIMRLKIKQCPDDGHGHGRCEGEDSEEEHLHSEAADAACLSYFGQDGGEHQRPVEDGDGEDAEGAEDRGRRDLVGADSEDLAEQQRVDLWGVLDAEAQEQRAEGEHRHEREGGRDVVAAPAAEQADRQSAAEREHAEPKSVLTPIRLAPAAPAKDPLGIAWAANADPRMTVKNPTTPATTATMLATSQALTMKPENIVLRR